MSEAARRRVYRLLLRLFPRDFREEFGADMERLFLDRCREVEGRGAAAVGLWVQAAWDVTSHGLRERVSRAGRAVEDILREGTTMDGWIQDLRFGARSLLRRPGFALASVGTLALGMGVTVAIFSVVNGVLLRPLPYPDSDRLVVVWRVDARRGSRSTNRDHPDIRAWQEALPDFRVAGFAGTRPTLTGAGDPEVLYGVRVSDGLLSVYGLEPALGRDLRAADDVPGGPRVVVVSHAFWTGRLGADPGVLGTTLTLDGEPWEVVGVAPRGFDEPDGTALWLPRRHPAGECGHGCNVMQVVGRLPSGADLEGVEERLHAVDRRLAEEFPNAHGDVVTELQRLHDYRVADVRPALWILLAAVGMVLLVACANVANLLMVRAAGRRAEVALRATLGAGRIRLLRQLLTESLLMATVGGVLGLLLAAAGVSALVSLAPPDLPRMAEVGLDGRVVAFTGAVAAGVAILFGLMPAARLTGQPLREGIRGVRTTRGGRRTGFSRSLLLTGEVALSLALLLGAGLLFRTLLEIRSVDLGFRAEGVERFRVSTPESRYDVEATLRFFDQLEGRLAALPEVEAAGMAFGVPLASGSIGTSMQLLDEPELPPADRPQAAVRPASPGYLEAAGIPLLRGRWFTSADRRDTQGVAVLNAAAARSFYPGGEALGKRLKMDVSWGFDEALPMTVVGIAGDVRSESATRPAEPAVYLPNAQFGADLMYVTLALAPGGRGALSRAREVIRELDPALAITSEERLEDVVRREGAATRFYLTLLILFSGLALVLAAVGLYGVVAYAVSRRTREIGIRMALGARQEDVTGLVVRQGVGPALAGIVLGLGLSWFGARTLQALLYGVEAQDPATLAVVTAVLLAVVAAATLLPARRAARIPPSAALRAE